jgi:phosphoglycolate phosphatase-like HAD superfamily hydrolase
VSFAGNTDRKVLAQVMERRGRRFDEAHAQRIFALVAEELRALLAEAAVREIPGAGAFVARLAEAGAALGLVTGNIRACAYLKLGSIGLDGYFGFGGFGDVHAERSMIARSAVAAARQAGVRTDRICLIGDTPYDVAAGRALGVPVLGVASGHYAAPELLAAGAGRAAADFRNLAGWMEWLEETLESQ